MEDSFLTSENKIIRYRDDTVSLKLSIPLQYPEMAGVTIINLSFHSADNTISNNSKVLISNEIESIICRNVGEETLFDIIDYLRSQKNLSEENNAQSSSGEKGNEYRNNDKKDSSDFDYLNNDECDLNIENMPASFNNSKFEIFQVSNSPIKVFHGVITIEKKSQFLSHFAYVTSLEEVNEFRSIILSDKKCSRATHNIFAYRFICPKSGK